MVAGEYMLRVRRGRTGEKRGPLPDRLVGPVWVAAVVVAGLGGFFAPRAVPVDMPGWAAVVLATALALSVAVLRLGILFARALRTRRAAEGSGE